ncbi:MAG: flagellar filament capping protein FliD, partial [Oceanobacter sp.]
DISTEASTVFGFVKGIGDGERGQDAQGEIDDASGIRLKVTGGDVGDRGSITYITGFADRLADLMDSILNGSNSVIETKLSTLETEQETIEEEKTKLDARISAQEARLKSQFLYNDSIISALNTTMDYLEQQFEAMRQSKE